MCDKHEVFVDGITQIHFYGNMVRFDFMTLQPAEYAEDSPKPKDSFRVIMNPQGFLATYNSMQQLVKKLIEAGILKPETPKSQPVEELKSEKDEEPTA